MRMEISRYESKCDAFSECRLANVKDRTVLKSFRKLYRNRAVAPDVMPSIYYKGHLRDWL